MRTEREIIDMDNFYETATLEEAIAYFKSVSSKCFAAINKCVDRMIGTIKRIASGMMARFAKLLSNGREVPTNKQLQDDFTYATIWLNTSKPSPEILSMLEELAEKQAMEETLEAALEILIKKSN